MIWHPKIGQKVKVNYKDKSMPLQGMIGIVAAIGNGKGPKNVLVVYYVPNSDYTSLSAQFVIVPRGNLNDS